MTFTANGKNETFAVSLRLFVQYSDLPIIIIIILFHYLSIHYS